MDDGNDYSAFVEGFTSIEKQGYDVFDPLTGEWRHYVVESGDVDFGIIRFRRAPWWRRLARWIRHGAE